MTVLYVDSFDHYTNLSQKGWYVDDASFVALSSTRARHGTQSLRLQAEHFAAWRWLPAGYGAVGVGIGLNWDDYNEDPIQFVQLADGQTKQVELGIDSTGHLYVSRNGTTIVGPGATALAVDTWYYIEWAVTIHDTTGTVDVLLNGVSELSATGLDTKNSTNATVNRLKLGPGPAGTSTQPFMYLDDLVVTDGALPGICTVAAFSPDSNGNSSSFTGSDGNSTDNYALVDEATPNDADYVESTTAGHRDLYGFANVPTDAGVVGVQLVGRVSKTDSGSRSMKFTARRGATNYDGSALAVKDGFGAELQVWTDDPSTATTWNAAQLNGAEFGVKVES